MENLASHELPRTVKDAKALGQLTGQSPDCCGVHCPYSHHVSDLRLAWFDGFGEGRIRLVHEHALLGRKPWSSDEAIAAG